MMRVQKTSVVVLLALAMGTYVSCSTVETESQDCAAPSLTGATRPTLGGEVLDTQGNPLPGASVQSGTRKTLSNALGAWGFGSLDTTRPADAAMLTIRRIGHGIWVEPAIDIATQNHGLFVRARLAPVVASTTALVGKINRVATDLDGDGEIDLTVSATPTTRKLESTAVFQAAFDRLYNSKEEAGAFERIPGTSYGVLTSGKKDLLEPFALLDVDVRDALTSLLMDESPTIDVSFELSREGALLANLEIPAFAMDLSTGVWEQRTVATTIQKNGRSVLKAKLDRYGPWLFAWPQQQHACAYGRIIDQNLRPQSHVKVFADGLSFAGRDVTSTNQEGVFAITTLRSTVLEQRTFQVSMQSGPVQTRLLSFVAGAEAFEASTVYGSSFHGKNETDQPLVFSRDCLNLGDLLARRDPSTVKGTLVSVDAHGLDQPIADATVFVLGGPSATAKTNACGQFVVPALQRDTSEGSTRIRVLAEHKTQRFRTLAVDLDETLESIRMVQRPEPPIVLGWLFHHWPVQPGGINRIDFFGADRDDPLPRSQIEASTGRLDLVEVGLIDESGTRLTDEQVATAKDVPILRTSVNWTPPDVDRVRSINDYLGAAYEATVTMQVLDSSLTAAFVTAETRIMDAPVVLDMQAPQQVIVGLTAKVDAIAIDPEGEPIEFVWSVNGQCDDVTRIPVPCKTTTPQVEIDIDEALQYKVQLTAKAQKSKLGTVQTVSIFGIP